jgi:hypothetical protein
VLPRLIAAMPSAGTPDIYSGRLLAARWRLPVAPDHEEDTFNDFHINQWHFFLLLMLLLREFSLDEFHARSKGTFGPTLVNKTTTTRVITNDPGQINHPRPLL